MVYRTCCWSVSSCASRLLVPRVRATTGERQAVKPRCSSSSRPSGKTPHDDTTSLIVQRERGDISFLALSKGLVLPISSVRMAKKLILSRAPRRRGTDRDQTARRALAGADAERAAAACRSRSRSPSAPPSHGRPGGGTAAVAGRPCGATAGGAGVRGRRDSAVGAGGRGRARPFVAAGFFKTVNWMHVRDLLLQLVILKLYYYNSTTL
jgi:hypothetical protein